MNLLPQTKPPVNHDDWTPVPDSWLRGPFRIEIEMTNMLSNIFLAIARRMYWNMGLKGGDPEQLTASFRYSQHCANIMKHRGLEVAPL
jgi:hypothetical protein